MNLSCRQIFELKRVIFSNTMRVSTTVIFVARRFIAIGIALPKLDWVVPGVISARSHKCQESQAFAVSPLSNSQIHYVTVYLAVLQANRRHRRCRTFRRNVLAFIPQTFIFTTTTKGKVASARTICGKV